MNNDAGCCENGGRTKTEFVSGNNFSVMIFLSINKNSVNSGLSFA
jgi:hypothetical protein